MERFSSPANPSGRQSSAEQVLLRWRCSGLVDAGRIRIKYIREFEEDLSDVE